MEDRSPTNRQSAVPPPPADKGGSPARVPPMRGGWRTWVLVIAALAALLLGFGIRGCFGGHQAAPPAQTGDQAQQLWTCSMHPEIKLPKPGKCPICAMDLIPTEGEQGADDAAGPRELTVSENARALMGVQSVPAERKFVQIAVRMVGKVEYDETLLKDITAWVAGRLDRVFVNYTGVPVSAGEHLVELYSPDLLAAQQELLQAARTVANLKPDDAGFLRSSAETTLAASREKLRLWGLQAEQIEEIEQRGEPTDRITIHAPIGGIVVDKQAQQGMYVTTGQKIYTIADLSQVWVQLEAYESDLPWLHYGQKASFTTEAYPGERFEGTIAFIDPVLTQTTRTVKVRVNAPNGEMKLKPGMFVRATVEAQVGEGGKVMAPELAGKWICSMHPEVLKEAPGKCDICQMDLVTTESLGYVGSESAAGDKPLVIPASAALVTGKRAVVYVELPDRDKPTFQGREVVLGPRAGDYYVVRQGLSEGELVVTDGSFKIDAELQIRAKPSMMSPEGGAPPPGHGHAAATQPATEAAATTAVVSDEFRRQLAGVVRAYLDIPEGLAADDAARAKDAAKATLAALDEVDMRLVEGQNHEAWMNSAGQLKELLDRLAEAGDIQAARAALAPLSQELIAAAQRFGVTEMTLHVIHCPMAFENRGADWLQTDTEVRNPYFGAQMFRCGELKQTLPPAGAKEDADE